MAADTGDTAEISVDNTGCSEATRDALFESIDTLMQTSELLGLPPLHALHHECTVDILQPSDDHDTFVIVHIKKDSEGNGISRNAHLVISPSGSDRFSYRCEFAG